MKPEDQVLYEKYLQDSLKEEARAAFQKRLAEDADFRREFELYQEMEGFVGERVEKGKALDVLRGVGRERKEGEKESVENFKKGQSNGRLISFVVVGIILGGLLTWVISSTLNQPVAKAEFAELYVEPAWPVERGTNDSIQLAISIYLNGNINKSISLLKEVRSKESNFWLTEIYVREKLFEKALNEMPKNNFEKLYRDRLFYLEILSLHMSNHDDILTQRLQETPKDFDEFYIEKLGPANSQNQE